MSYVLHLPAKNKELYGHLLKEKYTRNFVKPDIDIVIPITLDQVDNSLLIKQIHNSGYDYYNCIDKEIVWEKADKVRYVLKSLQMCPNEYIILLDGNDTVFTDNLTNIVETFNEYPDTGLVFNAEVYYYKKLKKSCLNGGVCFGKKEDMIKFYTDACMYLSMDKKKFPSEQKYLLASLSNNKKIARIDTKEILFKCFNYEFNGK